MPTNAKKQGCSGFSGKLANYGECEMFNRKLRNDLQSIPNLEPTGVQVGDKPAAGLLRSGGGGGKPMLLSKAHTNTLFEILY